MTDQLRDLLREESERIDVPPPPTKAIVVGAERRVRVRRGARLIAVAASVIVIAGGIVGVNRLLAGKAPDSAPDVATNSPSASTSTDPTPPGLLTVSGTGAGAAQFGAGADEVVAATITRLGAPDFVFGPREYSRIAGQDGWYDDPADTLSLSWKYRTMSATCWSQFCLIFGGNDADSLKFRGWELAVYSRWSDSEVTTDGSSLDVRLADSGIGLGDTWKRLHAAYPGTKAGGGEGGSLVVSKTPWPGVFDGVGEWRLSGQWDYTRPEFAPPGAKVTRLSGGEGPEPGCC